MFFKIPQVLTPEALEKITTTLTEAEFVDGKLTAGWYAKLVKENQQLAKATPTAQALEEQVRQALQNNALFQTAIRPKTVHTLLFSRYGPGMAYGRHTDNALMNGMRSDVSFTLFLNEPSDYEGGELVIEGADSEQSYKLPAGTAIAYPSTSLHRVNVVTKGTRLVAVGWVQSWIRDAQKREIVFDLDVSRRSLFAQSGKTTEFDLLSKSVANLLRLWSE
ncbi:MULTISPECIES: Fe2+-dependent dioxygenase [unclassified Picosynechococcus]|uniref:Fe2+-dependent dioxygenase n=1 Tax=unclassified Picosynechococcus TaxID=3079910 RepID=UPI0007458532|nr:MULTISPECIES: Fe2+-dependent dioxygenase [unclassified Picosynechococcus]AMA10208.1 PKHD-type hydroxylase [Picosynechococcus sp. PCC 73109]ANV91566.1 Fe2+-dependent dioxygenase [Picosynechococcus sp. PCC 8807]